MNDWIQLRICAEMYEDIQKTKQANDNRAKRGGVNADVFGVVFGHFSDVEKKFAKALKDEMKRVVPPAILDWQKSQPGIGEHLLARLLGVTGHPVHTVGHHWEKRDGKRVLVQDEPFDRTLAQFQQYCGHGDAARKRRKGMTQDEAVALGNPRAKMLVHLMASFARQAGIRHGEPVTHYGHIAYLRKKEAADKVHSTQCQNSNRPPQKSNGCGTQANPEWGAPGSPWRPGHQDGHALRMLGKAILEDLYYAALEES